MGVAGGRRGWRAFWALLGLMAAGLVGAVAWLGRAPECAGPPVPSPNGYDAFLAAGRLVAGVPADRRLDNATDETLRAFLAANGPAQAEARRGLGLESVVPLGRMPSLEAHMADLGPIRAVWNLLDARMVLARRAGPPAEALAAALDLLRFAHGIEAGGLMLDRSLGLAFRRRALDGLAAARLGEQSAADARRAIAAIDRLDRAREPLAAVDARDAAFVVGRQGLQMRVIYALNRKAMDAMKLPALRATGASDAQLAAQSRRLIARLALQAYARDHPDAPRPPDLAALVPAYLPAIPTAPDGQPALLDDFPPEPTPE